MGPDHPRRRRPRARERLLKPLLTFIALPLILLTFGVAYFFVNVVILLFTEWVVPDFVINGFWTYVGAMILIWLVNWLGSLALGAVIPDAD